MEFQVPKFLPDPARCEVEYSYTSDNLSLSYNVDSFDTTEALFGFQNLYFTWAAGLYEITVYGKVGSIYNEFEESVTFTLEVVDPCLSASYTKVQKILL